MASAGGRRAPSSVRAMVRPSGEAGDRRLARAIANRIVPPRPADRQDIEEASHAVQARNPRWRSRGLGDASARRLAQTSPPPTILRLQRRDIEVNGRTASVYGIRQPDGTFGLTTEVGKPFRVRVENGIDQPSLIHWHGLTPPWRQDSVPGISSPPIPPGGSADYDFPLRFGGTFWMHSHQGLQEQILMTAPLIIHDQRDAPTSRRSSSCWPISASPRPSRFSPTSRRRGRWREWPAPGPTAKPGAMSGDGGDKRRDAAAAPDLNDVKYDAFLANFRTLADPETIKVEPGGRVLLRIINSASMSNFHIDLGRLEGDPDRDRRFRGRADPRPPLPGRGRAAARHPGHAAAGAGRLSGPGATGRRARPDRYRARRRKGEGRSAVCASGDSFPGVDPRSREPPARVAAAQRPQGEPRPHA